MIEQLLTLFRQLTLSQRIGIALGAAASTVVLVGFVLWASHPDYQPAFTRLTATQAAAVAEALRSAKIPFQVADAGSTILVPSGSLSDARVAAAAAGVQLDGTTGWEIFDRQNFGASQFEQNVAYQRALEAKLAATIGAMAGVAQATVSIVPQQQGLFPSDDRPASASVYVRMQNGAPPDPAMVQGIVNTVAGAVAGLSPDQVTVVDDHGRVLAGPGRSFAGDALAMQDAVERSVAAKAQALLDGVLGPGHATVAVSADLDLDKVEQTITTVKPIDAGNWTPTSVQTIDESYSGAGLPGAMGIPGASSNIPGLPTYPGFPLPSPAANGGGPAPTTTGGGPSPTPAGGSGAAGQPAPTASPTAAAVSPAPSTTPGPATGASPRPAASPAPSPSAPTAGSSSGGTGGASAASSAPSSSPGGGYARSERTVNYANSETVEKVIHQPGTIRRLSVAVLVDQAALGSLSVDGLTSSVAAAIGADSSRGDVVNVAAVPFASPTPVSSGPLPLPADQGLLAGIGSALSTLAGLGLAGLLVLLVWRNARALRRRAEAIHLATVLEPQLLAAGREGAAQVEAGAAAGGEARPAERISDRIRTVAVERPEAVANVLHGWLREEGRK
jgi:flagellar biosynthesis/type III secretory pathway M-ring protein FliF/YscJ